MEKSLLLFLFFFLIPPFILNNLKVKCFSHGKNQPLSYQSSIKNIILHTTSSGFFKSSTSSCNFPLLDLSRTFKLRTWEAKQEVTFLWTRKLGGRWGNGRENQARRRKPPYFASVNQNPVFECLLMSPPKDHTSQRRALYPPAAPSHDERNDPVHSRFKRVHALKHSS